MKTTVLLGAMAALLPFTGVEAAFEETNPIQIANIVRLTGQSMYAPEEIKRYDLAEIYIAGALLSEGWGCDRDEEKALSLYRATLEELRQHPMDLDSVWHEGIDDEQYRTESGHKFLNVFKAELDQARKPFLLYALMVDTIRMMLQQGCSEEALKLIEEGRRLSMLRGKEIPEAGTLSEKREEQAVKETVQVVRFYETLLSNGVEEGYLLFDTLFHRKGNKRSAGELASRACLHNQIIKELVVKGFEQKTEEEKMKAFPYVLRSAGLGIPQAMIAMYLYYKNGCGELPPDKKKAEAWLKKACDMAPSCLTSG